ncbi:hypothetical protein [Alkaliphilus metalliredigens]|nr:hypothetical protein [Alkaliphilus metalliredigens]
MFQKEVFKELIQKSIGDANITKFSKFSGVNRTYLSKFLNTKLHSPPSPNVIKRIAESSQARVSYEELMEAGGYLEVNINTLLTSQELWILKSCLSWYMQSRKCTDQEASKEMNHLIDKMNKLCDE